MVEDGRRLDRAGDPDIGGVNGEKSEVGGGHFEKGPWLSVCSAVDAPIPEEGASDAECELIRSALSLPVRCFKVRRASSCTAMLKIAIPLCLDTRRDDGLLCVLRSDTAVQVFLSLALSPMSEVLAGEFDLRVPVMMAVIDVYTRQSQSDTAVELVVSCNRFS